MVTSIPLSSGFPHGTCSGKYYGLPSESPDGSPILCYRKKNTLMQVICKDKDFFAKPAVGRQTGISPASL